MSEAQIEDQLAEALRMQRLVEINAAPQDREMLEAKYGQVWDTEQLREDFMVTGFCAPFVVVRRRSDGQLGSLEFQHDLSRRYYFNWRAEES